MGLWMMAWAGLVPVGGLIGGVVMDAIGMTSVLVAGAVVALILAVVVNLREPSIGDLELPDRAMAVHPQPRNRLTTNPSQVGN